MPRPKLPKQGRGTGGSGPTPPSPPPKKTASDYRRDYGEQVDYNGVDPLSRAAYEARERMNLYRSGENLSDRNFAAAKLSDGSVITGMSGKGHSEDDILEQVRNRRPPVTIERLYSERQPCCDCESKLKNAGLGSDKVSYSIEYFDTPNPNKQDKSNLRILNSGVHDALNTMIRRQKGL